MSVALTFPVPIVEPDVPTPLSPVLSLLDDTGTAVSGTDWSAARLTAAVRRGDEEAVRMLTSRGRAFS